MGMKVATPFSQQAKVEIGKVGCFFIGGLPGTHIEFGMAPVTNSTSLISELSMELKVSKLFFKSMEATRSMYSDYRLNDLVVTELLSK